MIETFMKQFLDTWFYNKDSSALETFFDKNICLIFNASAEKYTGKEASIKALIKRKKKVSGYYLNDFEMSNPSKGIYSVFGDCILTYTSTSQTSMIRMNTLILEEKGTLKILHLQFSLLFDALNEFDLQDKKMDVLYQSMLENRRRLDTAIAHCGLSIWEYDIKKHCIYQKDNSQQMHGLMHVVENVPDGLIASGFVHPDSAASFKKMYQQLFDGAEKAEGVFQVRSHDEGAYWWEKITYMNDFDEQHQPIRALGFSTDVTQQVIAQQELQRMELQKQMLEQKTLLNIIVDLTSNKVLGIDAHAMDSIIDGIHTLEDISSFFIKHSVQASHQQHLQEIFTLNHLKKENGQKDERYDFLYKDGKKEPIWVQLSLHVNKNPENHHQILNGYIENIDERKKREMELKSHAEIDGLTQIYNRKTFQMLTENMLVTRIEHKHILFGVVDIDDFKSINDQYGHYYGDVVLQKVAKALRDSFGNHGFVGRLGGDEFIFTYADYLNFPYLKKKLNSLFETLYTADENISIPIQVSIGIAIAPWDGNTFDVLYKKADIALYQVKKEGKNHWHMYHDTSRYQN